MKGIRKCRNGAIIIAVLCIPAIMCGPAFGAGFALTEQSVKGLGIAHAGRAAAAEDASTIYSNPAGLALLPGPQFIAGLHAAFPSARFRNEGSLHATGLPLTGSNGGDAGVAEFIPAVYYSSRVNDRLSAGLGVFVPFGLHTEYDRSWAGRYHAVESDLNTLNLNPAAACRLTDRISIGAGLNLQYIRVKLSNSVDFGSIFGSLGVPGMVPQGNDGFVTLEADSWAFGYNAGVLYEFSRNARTGVAYRSRIRQELTGDADFSGVPSPNRTGRFLDSGIKADATLPDMISLSHWHAVSEEFAVMADVTWTNWSTFREIRIRFDNPLETDAVTTTHWKDSFRYSIGGAYMPGRWAFRAGAAYDRTPVRSAALRTPGIPDGDRTWLALGIGFSMTAKASVDLGYAHLFVKDPEIRKTAAGEDLLRGGLSGSYENEADIVGIEFAWTF